MTVLEKNLDALEKRFPGIRGIIEEKKEELLDKEGLNITVEENFEGEEIFKVKKGERTLYLGGKRSARDSARKQIQVWGKIEYSAPVFMVGMGNICYIEEFFSAVPEKNDNMLLIYEPSFSVFYAQLQRVDMEKLLGKRIVALMVEGINADGIKNIISQMVRGDRTAIFKYCVLPNTYELYPDEVVAFIKNLKEATAEQVIYRNTKYRFSAVFAENLFMNADYIRTGYHVKQLMKAVPTDIPAIVVSAGPSLNKNIEELKKAKNRAFIIAVDTALKPLLNHGIIPDMYALVDGKKPLSLIDAEEGKNIPLVSACEAAHQVLEFHKGKKFFYRSGYEFLDKMYTMNKKEFPAMTVGGSVATLAFALACYLGIEKVILVGQDLALSGNRTHADGTFRETMEEIDTSNMKKVPGNVEELVPTRDDFDSYRIWFEDFIENWRKKYANFRVINATEGGARIRGTEIMTLREAIEIECTKDVDVSAAIEKLEPAFTEEEQKKILEYFKTIPQMFHEIISLAKDGKGLYKKLNKLTQNHNVDQAAYEKVLKQIKKNSKKIEKNTMNQIVVDTLVRADKMIQLSQYEEYQSFEKECSEIARKGTLYLELIEECATLYETESEELLLKEKNKM